ncbi:hypothetical protein D6853_01490 [Butyrivibrio sp. X503]|uniref:alpha/beta fold hydrolase n=1 Tax=Butyrivibrio sp. X503 TaxID=2364878 RepID=UPI000EA856CF|nr:hypothetical protein [Butyrivibrio sp. X503]RKM58239.1 hypothetical protein D6853_01490 [Butyrivibrio sp. X503]
MYIREYGDPRNPVVILLAPLFLTGKQFYEMIHQYLRGDYFIIAPDHGGHGKSGEYISSKDEYEQLKKYLTEKGYTDIKLLYGASLGAATGWHIFNDSSFNIEKTWFDGVGLAESNPFIEWIMKRVFHKKKKDVERKYETVEAGLIKEYRETIGKYMTDCLAKFDKKRIDALCEACCRFELKPLSDKQQESLHLDYGENELNLRIINKAKTIEKYMPKVRPVVRKGLPHCGYIAFHLKEYVDELEEFTLKS